MKQFIDAYDFGAAGDGVTDDTAAVQAAIDEAANTGRTLYLAPGKYVCGELFMHPEVYIRADATWGFRPEANGNTVLLQRDAEQKCVLDMTHANGATLDGVVIAGNKTGDCCGILSRKKDYGVKEDAYRIENCRVSGFSSHAVFLDRIWCFSVRHSMFCFSRGDGLAMKGWDGFVMDNWFSGNGGAGFGSIDENCSVTMTGNRIEWNRGCGIRIENGTHYNITGNYIDRSGKEAILLRNANTITCTGNILYRSGKFNADDPYSAQCGIENGSGITFTGNTFCVGRDDGGKGTLSPYYALRIEKLHSCTVFGNTMYRGGVNGTLDDRGGHEDSVIENNVGSASGI